MFTAAIATAFPDLPSPPPAVVTVSAKGGDYQCNSAMQVAGLLKAVAAAKGTKPPAPRDVATSVLANLPQTILIEKCDIGGPGFINIYLNQVYVEKMITWILLNGVQPPKHAKRTVCVDFSSPNIGEYTNLKTTARNNLQANNGINWKLYFHCFQPRKCTSVICGQRLSVNPFAGYSNTWATKCCD